MPKVNIFNKVMSKGDRASGLVFNLKNTTKEVSIIVDRSVLPELNEGVTIFGDVYISVADQPYKHFVNFSLFAGEHKRGNGHILNESRTRQSLYLFQGNRRKLKVRFRCEQAAHIKCAIEEFTDQKLPVVDMGIRQHIRW